MTTESTAIYLPADGTTLRQILDGPPLLSGRDWFLSRPPDRRANGAAKDPTPTVNWAKLDEVMRDAYARRVDDLNWRRWHLGEWKVEVGPPEPVPPS